MAGRFPNVGISKNEANQHQGLKLSAFLCQFAAIAESGQWNPISDRQRIANRWDKDVRLDLCKPLFALYGLRQADAHTSSSTKAKEQASNLQTFGINPDKFKEAGGKRWTSSTIQQLNHCGNLPICFDLGHQRDSAHKYADP